jgi:hypothetical protein
VNPEIAKRFEGIETRRKALVKRVRDLPTDKQNLKPSAKEFSPVEVIQHMVLAERGNVAFLTKSPPPTLKGKRPKTTFLFRVTVAKLQNPTKPLATVKYMVPTGPVDLEKAAKDWESVRQETAGFLEQVERPDEPFIKFLFFFGLGSASDYLSLLGAHLTYHEQRFPTA